MWSRPSPGQNAVSSPCAATAAKHSCHRTTSNTPASPGAGPTRPAGPGWPGRTSQAGPAGDLAGPARPGDHAGTCVTTLLQVATQDIGQLTDFGSPGRAVLESA